MPWWWWTTTAWPGRPTAARNRGLKVWRVSARRRDADVCVTADEGALSVWVHGQPVVEHVPVDVRPDNVAAAVAVALELGVPSDEIGRLVATLPGAPHRLERSVSAGGVVVLDDTYNANPVGARVALATLERVGAEAHRRVVVTPGMVELGPRQADENARFAAQAAAVATDVVVVGRTNRRALVRGAHDGNVAQVVTLPTRAAGHGVGARPTRAGRRGAVRERPARPLPLSGPR